MGFSVSGSFAILVLASFIAFGMLYSAGANSFERVSDATSDAYEKDLDRRNTAIEIGNVSYDGNLLDVEANNTGTTALSVKDTDLIVDNVYQRHDDGDVSISVVGNPDSGLWLPGQTLSLEVTTTEAPGRVKIVTEHGVADVEVVA